MNCKIWHNNNMLLLLPMLLTLICLLQMQLNIAAKTFVFRYTKEQKSAFLTYARTNGACVNNFMRLWHEEMSVEERAHWDGINELQLKYFDQFIKLFSFSFTNGQVTMDVNKFKLSGNWSFDLYIFKSFSFYFSPNGQISHRNMSKIAFLLCWQRLRFMPAKQVNWRFESYNVLEKKLASTKRDVYLCDLLDIAFRMPTADKSNADERERSQTQQMQGKNMVNSGGKTAGSKSSEQLDIRAMFQKMFDQQYVTSKNIKYNRRAKLGAIYNQWMDNIQFRYWKWELFLTKKQINEQSMALAKFAEHYIDNIVGDDDNDVRKPTKESALNRFLWTTKSELSTLSNGSSKWRIRSYNEMKEHFAADPGEWKSVKQIVYKYMELYSRKLTSFDPYEASELPMLIFMFLYENVTGENLKSLRVSSEKKECSVHDLRLSQVLDAWKPRWLLTSNGSGIYPMEEPLKRLISVSIPEGKENNSNEKTVADQQIFMPIDEMDFEHIKFLLEKHELADWKWSEITPAPIHDINSNEILALDIVTFMINEDKMDASMKDNEIDLLAQYQSQGNNLLTYQDWVTQSYRLFKLQHLTTNGGNSRNNAGRSSLSSVHSEVQRLDFAIQIYLRLFRKFVQKVSEQPRARNSNEASLINVLEHMKNDAASIGRKLVQLLIAKREAEQREATKPVNNSKCEVLAASNHAHQQNWIDKKLAQFASKAPNDSQTLTTASLLIDDDDHCIEASTPWVHRLIRFDLENETSLAWKLLGLVSVNDQNNGVRIEFGEERLMMKLINGVLERKGESKKEKKARGNIIKRNFGKLQIFDKLLDGLDEQKDKDRAEAKKILNNIFATPDTKLWQWAQRRMEIMVAMLPQQHGWPQEKQVPNWVEEFRKKLGRRRKIQRVEYNVKELDLVRLFAYVQLGALISLNRLIAERMWKDLMDGTQTLKTTMFNTEEEKAEPTKSVLELRALFIYKLQSLRTYIAQDIINKRKIGKQLMGLQPTAIRPNYQAKMLQHGQILEQAKMFEQHEMMRAEMVVYGHKIADKMLAKKAEWRQQQQHQRPPTVSIIGGGVGSRQTLQQHTNAVAMPADPYSCSFYLKGYYYYQAHQSCKSGSSNTSGGGTLMMNEEKIYFSNDISGGNIIDSSGIDDGWTDIIASASDLFLSAVRNSAIRDVFANVSGGDSIDAVANECSNLHDIVKDGHRPHGLNFDVINLVPVIPL